MRFPSNNRGIHWCVWQSCFSQSHKVGNVVIIVNFMLPYICNFLLYLQQMMSVNVKLKGIHEDIPIYISIYMRIIFQSYMFHWSS